MGPNVGELTFRCNICGAVGSVLLEQLKRETASCDSCRSSPRTRAIVDILLGELIGRRLTLEEVTTRKDLRGLGLTDSENYASRLKVKFNYQNTYFHREPRMDIAANLPPEKVGIYDFVTSSEIFEHVVPPVGRAFENAYRLLKPGGLLLLSVPYGTQPDTIEHFPDLYDFTVA